MAQEQQEKEQEEQQQGQGEEGHEAESEEQAKARKVEEETEKAKEKVRELEEDPPEKLEDWPDDKSKYETFGGPEGPHSYEEGPEKKLGPSSLRHREDGKVEIEGEEVDDPEEYKTEPIPGGPTDPDAPRVYGEPDLSGEGHAGDGDSDDGESREDDGDGNGESSGGEREEAGKRSDRD